MIWNHSTPQPPVPQELREMLKDYPEYLQTLQTDLMRVITKPSIATPPLEVAIWELEGTLETFMREAHDELEAAIVSGDADAITRARKKDLAVGSARMNLINLLDDEFDAYFKLHGRFA